MDIELSSSRPDPNDLWHGGVFLLLLRSDAVIQPVFGKRIQCLSLYFGNKDHQSTRIKVYMAAHGTVFRHTVAKNGIFVRCV